MTTPTKTFLAIFLGSDDVHMMDAWKSMPEAERRVKEQAGIVAWHAWAEKHKENIVELGSPLGATKRISKRGIEDVRNNMGAWTVVRATSHEEAAKLFENHPHFTVFPGECIEVMECLPVPGAP